MINKKSLSKKRLDSMKAFSKSKVFEDTIKRFYPNVKFVTVKAVK